MGYSTETTVSSSTTHRRVSGLFLDEDSLLLVADLETENVWKCGDDRREIFLDNSFETLMQIENLKCK